MKKALLVLVLLLLALFGWSFAPVKLDVSGVSAPVLPPAPAASPVQVGVLHTGSMLSQAVFAYRGGSFEPREFGMDVIVVRHPRGTLLIDAGFGSKVAEHLKTTPWLMQATTTITAPEPAALQLAALGITPQQLIGVLLTHAHWDHVSGLADLPGVPVFVNAIEQDFIVHGGEMSSLMRSFGTVNYQLYDFEHGPYAGFAASHDFFGDGTVIVVPAGGHTPGSVIVFVNASTQRYAFIGDLAWQHEGVDLPAERPWLSRELVDVDPARVRTDLVRLHQLQQANPDLKVLPAHDRRLTSQLPDVRTLFAAPVPAAAIERP